MSALKTISNLLVVLYDNDQKLFEEVIKNRYRNMSEDASLWEIQNIYVAPKKVRIVYDYEDIFVLQHEAYVDIDEILAFVEKIDPKLVRDLECG